MVAGLAATVLGVLATPAHGAASPDRDASTILVKLSIPSQAARLFEAFGDRASARLADNVFVVKLPSGRSTETALALYERAFGVAYAEPNYLASAALSSPNDASASSQWNLGAVSAVAGWSRLFGSYPGSVNGPLIAVVDTGIQASHPDLAGRVVPGGNCVSGTCSSGGSDDDNNHGTHVGGIAAAATNNGLGVAGLALSSPLLPVKVLNASASGSYAAISAGIDYAVQRGARVVNLSLSGSSASTTLCGAVSRAVSAGVVVVAAAGNNASTAPSYPAACPGAIGVAATTSADVYASFSSYGSPNVFVSAPGNAIYSTIRGSSYGTMNGTSMAAPHVAALAALLLAQTPGRSVANVKSILATTSDKVGGGTYGADPYGTCAGCTWSTRYGYGRINLDRALGAVPGPPPPPPPPPGDSIDPQAPASLTAVATGTTINLAWPAATDNVGVTGYEVERCPPGCASFAFLATTTGNTHADTGLAGSTTFGYRVRARDAAGNWSGYSPVAFATTASSPPPPPSSLTTTFPTAVTAVSGTITSGSAASLDAVDQNMLVVRSGFLSGASWYGTFSAAAGASDFRVTFTGNASRSCTLTLSIYRWSTATWVNVGSSRSLGPTELTVSDQAADPTIPAAELRSSSGQVRIRATCSVFTFSAYTSSTNRLQLSYRS